MAYVLLMSVVSSQNFFSIFSTLHSVLVISFDFILLIFGELSNSTKSNFGLDDFGHTYMHFVKFCN